MSYDIYAAKLGTDGSYGPVMPFKHADLGSYDDCGDYQLNADYIPGVAMNMSGGNYYQLVQGKLGVLVDAFESMDMQEQRALVLKALEQPLEPYFVQRLVELLNILDMGIARGAERLARV